ncbi:MAG: class I SAM-dependent methyltransferase [Nanoarchaeota archaeon]|nr:class I SAM-dependent methyltransferase [Nanoarchaeota archaeon]MBU1320872.1 class I SAM-dependent methyltransferase [Nanoarchaeota archaeon]MBU1597778.1 class I SAM-dependent methyltransferase [Nanoarchaeota archaeon]MBU2441229.1 class I SAM-dependent methyltransferase [Nanoarchaeota archaeon]
MNTCSVCKEEKVKVLLDFGMQPVCNRFLKKPEEVKGEYKHSLMIGQCLTCGSIQVVNSFPVAELKPEHTWIVRYAEPEEHLDNLADKIANLAGLNPESKFLGISFKDVSLIERMKHKGFENVHCLDTKKDLLITEIAGVESVQDKFTVEKSRELVKKHGRYDIIIARHILEHVYSPKDFMDSLKELLKPEGYIIIEVPGCDQAFELFDYTIPWEEHTLYFTRQSFKHFFGFAGLNIESFEEIDYPLESSLIVIARLKKKQNVSDSSLFPTKDFLSKELELGDAFAKGFSRREKELKNYLSDKKGVALFGAGHLACSYINFFDIKEQIDFVVDDDPNKKGLFMAGSGIPIFGSGALVEKNIGLCLLSLNPRNEDKVIQKNQAFINNKGIFLSIFPSSKHALKLG